MPGIYNIYDSSSQNDARIINALEMKLIDFSQDFYRTKENRAETAQKYRAVYACLRALGWDGGIDLDAQLPDEYMPQEYLERKAEANKRYEEKKSQQSD